MKKLIQNIGINDININKKSKVYIKWSSMFQRCYDNKFHIKHPTYIGCSVCDEWLLLSNFKKWFDENYKEGLHLDKDILVQGNKVYSPDTCCFVPQYINSLLLDSGRIRGDLPLGVSLIMTKRQKIPTYSARCKNGYGSPLSKTFKTVEEAQAWYAETKKKVIKEQAQRAFLDNLINTDVYLALVRRNIV